MGFVQACSISSRADFERTFTSREPGRPKESGFEGRMDTPNRLGRSSESIWTPVQSVSIADFFLNHVNRAGSDPDVPGRLGVWRRR